MKLIHTLLDLLTPITVIAHKGDHTPKTIDFASLSLLLSPSSSITFPKASSLNPLLRWSFNINVNYPALPRAVVSPATEADVVATIKFSNKHEIPFLVQGGGHATSASLKEFKEGVLISMKKFDKLEIKPGRKTALIGVGLKVNDVVHGLWKEGLQTTTGICACAGAVGPALGGGHGFLQGQYGLAADEIVRNEDLFWAIRGAGHNFGVITEMEYKVHEVEEGKKTWAVQAFVFTGSVEHVEELYKVAEELRKKQPKEMVVWSMWFVDEKIDKTTPIIAFQFMYNGPQSDFVAYTKPLADFTPIATFSNVTDYPGLMTFIGTHLEGPLCPEKSTAVLHAADVDYYDVPAIRNVWELFNEMVTTVPGLAGSYMMLEGYSVQAMQAVPEESTAYPHRKQDFLLAPILLWVNGNKTLDELGEKWGIKLKQASWSKFRPRSYINYAAVDESLETLYGEQWRLKKLRRIKETYDPENHFRFFSPIIRREKPEKTRKEEL